MPPTSAKEERDLSFKPVVNGSPRRLTPQQIRFFNEFGYVMPLDAFTPKEAEANRIYFDILLAKVQKARSDLDAYSVNGFQVCCGGLYDIVTNPVIVDYVSDLIGPDVICWGTHFFCKLAHDPRQVAWHQDASYWPLTPARTVTVWLAIDDADVGNACMRYIPGSHVLGHLTYTLSENDEANVLNQTVAGAEQLGEPVLVALKAGEISIHSDLLLHGSEANQSARRRCGLTLRYCAADVRARLGWNAKGVIVSGRDESGHWSNPARPETE